MSDTPEERPDDPFSQLPMFGELAKALAGQGPLNWDAARQFAQGDTIETCPTIVVPLRDRRAVQSTILSQYSFAWGKRVALAQGFGGLYNHAYDPTARFEVDIAGGVIRFLARRKIPVRGREHARIDPRRARGRAVVFQLAEAGEMLRGITALITVHLLEELDS